MWFQLPCVLVLATVVGVAACATATVLAVVAVVVLAVVAAVGLAAVEAVEAPLDAPAAMQPVRIAAVATPASPVIRRARWAGCGRRRRAGRTALVGTAALLVASSVLFSMMSIAALLWFVGRSSS